MVSFSESICKSEDPVHYVREDEGTDEGSMVTFWSAMMVTAVAKRRAGNAGLPVLVS